MLLLLLLLLLFAVLCCVWLERIHDIPSIKSLSRCVSLLRHSSSHVQSERHSWPCSESKRESRDMETLCSALLAGAETVHCRELRSAVQAASLGECASTARLDNAQLWEQFHSITNEMIVTKAGRCVF